MVESHALVSIDVARRMVKELAADRFPNGKVIAVHVRRDFDFDNEPILLVELIIDKSDGLDAVKASGLVRHLRSKLVKIGESAFPLLSFVAKTEAENMRIETT